MDILLTLLAVLIAGLVLWDQFVKVFSTGGAGPLSQRGSQGLWYVLLLEVTRNLSLHPWAARISQQVASQGIFRAARAGRRQRMSIRV